MSGGREESLRELLARVSEHLKRAGEVDGESRRLLAALTQDIERKLGRAHTTRLGRESLDRLDALAVRFETKHPALAQVLRELIDSLGKAGI